MFHVKHFDNHAYKNIKRGIGTLPNFVRPFHYFSLLTTHFSLLLQHILLPKNKCDDQGEQDADEDDGDEAEGGFGEGDRDVDAPQAVNQGGDRQDNGDRGEEFHDLGQPVGNNGGEGVHHGHQNVGVNFRHFQCLLIFDDDVFQEVFVFFIHLEQRVKRAISQTHETFHHIFVGV